MGTSDSFAKRRVETMTTRRTKAFEMILDSIEEAKRLEKEGKAQESKALLDSVRKKVIHMIKVLENSIVETPEGECDRTKLPREGELIAQNDLVVIKMIDSSEYDSYMDVSYICSLFKDKYAEEGFKKTEWESFLAEHKVVVSIYDKKTGSFVGYCSVNDIREKDWEIAIEENVEFRNKGYGYNALSLFINKLTELTGQRFYRAVIDIDNYASQNLFKKLGAYPNGISEYILHGDDLEKFQKENIDLIDDNIKRFADEFNIDPEDLLGHVVEYRIDMKNL